MSQWGKRTAQLGAVGGEAKLVAWQTECPTPGEKRVACCEPGSQQWFDPREGVADQQPREPRSRGVFATSRGESATPRPASLDTPTGPNIIAHTTLRLFGQSSCK